MVTEESVKKTEKPASDTTRIQIPYEDQHILSYIVKPWKVYVSLRYIQ